MKASRGKPAKSVSVAWYQRPWVYVALLLLLVALVYYPVFGFGFVNYDDDHYIVENPFVQRGFDAESLRWAWTTTTMGNWHPLTWMSHMLDWQLYGADPAGHHAT